MGSGNQISRQKCTTAHSERMRCASQQDEELSVHAVWVAVRKACYRFLHEVYCAEHSQYHNAKGSVNTFKSFTQMHLDKPCVAIARLKQEVEVKQHSLRLLQERISGSESAQLADAVAATQAELEQAKLAAEAAKQKKADMIKTAKVGCASACSAL